MTVKEIVKAYLEENGYDGLFQDDCACKIDDLMRFMPCDPLPENCMAGYLKKPCHPGKYWNCEYDFIIGEKKGICNLCWRE